MHYKLTKNESHFVSHKKVEKNFLLINGDGLVVGRLAAHIVSLLKGKHKTSYTPNSDNGDKVVVINCSNLAFTGDKATDKKYYFHSGFVGGLKERTAKEIRASANPCDVLYLAVKRMLGKGPMANKRLGNLYLFWDDKHKFTTVKMKELDFKSLNIKNSINV